MKPAKAEPVAHETELLRLTLTSDAERRLGLQTVAIGSGAARRVRAAHGEIVAAPYAGGLPTASGTDLGTLAANQTRTDGDVARARAEAAAVLGVARASLATAQAQRGHAVEGLLIRPPSLLLIVHRFISSTLPAKNCEAWL
ncbi:MAG TPA: hypothetical protein PLH31_08185, partial [Caulobacter sp.]|nr:hypothetical protein [Caulobacter sp.]